ncbi:MAG: hypothetical protein ACK2TV_11685 [Anaerolineales bacterium]
MKTSKMRLMLSIVGGILLIAAGVVFLLDNMGLITLDWEMLVGPMFGIGGLIFLLVFILNTEEWWALIPGFVLVGIGIIIFTSQNLETIADRWSGAVFLGMLSLAFIIIYATHIEHWWAIIPGGVLLTLAGVTLLPPGDNFTGGVFFLGMAITFFLLYFLPKPSGKLKWAIYPAGILLILGILAVLGATNFADYVLPVVLLVVGGFFIYRAITKKQ